MEVDRLLLLHATPQTRSEFGLTLLKLNDPELVGVMGCLVAYGRESRSIEMGGWPLAKIGNASTVKLCLCLGANPRRFRFGGKKEAGGVCRGRG